MINDGKQGGKRTMERMCLAASLSALLFTLVMVLNSAITKVDASGLVMIFDGISSFLSHTFTAARPDWPIWILSVATVFLEGQVAWLMKFWTKRGTALTMI